MAVTAKRDITITIGDYYAHKIILPSIDEDGNAITWAGASFSSQIRETAAAATALVSFSVDTAHTGEDPPYIVSTLSSATTSSLTAGTYVWDFQETRSSKTRTPVGGLARVIQDVTR